MVQLRAAPSLWSRSSLFCAEIAVLLASILAITAASCESRSLVTVDVLGDTTYTLVNLHLTAAGTTKTFAGATFSPTVSFKVGLYLPAGTGGQVPISATVDDGNCLRGQGQNVIAGVTSGATAETTLVITQVAGCQTVGVGTGGKSGNSGAGGGGGSNGGGVGGFIAGTGTGGNTTGVGGFTGSGTGGTVTGVGGFTGSGTGGHVTGVGGFIAGTGGAIIGTGGAGGDPGCAIVHCPASLPNCCSSWFPFALDPGGISDSAILGSFTDSTAVVADTYYFQEVSQVGALGFDMTAGLAISSFGINATYTSGVVMPIYASFESPSGDAGCLYALNVGGYVDTTVPVAGTCRGGYPAGYAEKVNIRMDSTEAGTGSLSITRVDLVP